MGEQFAGVDPERVAQAAGALEQLRDALSANVPIITSTMAAYGAEVNLSPLRVALGRAPGEAADMRARARLAAIAAATPGALSTTGMVSIPWDHQSVDAADAQAEAQALAVAEASKDPKAARAAIQAIQQDLADHQGDTTYLSAFYNAAGRQVTSLARVLNSEDGHGGTLLTQQDDKILATFAHGLATVTRLPAGQGLSAEALAQYTKPQDVWSAAMLIKAGPAGQAYGTGQGAELLAGLTRTILDARASGQFTIPLDTSQLRDGPYDQQVQQALRNYDPLVALLRTDAQNQMAAMEVIGGPNGAAYARQLLHTPFSRYSFEMDSNGKTVFHSISPDPNQPPFGPDIREGLLPQQILANFLSASTSGPREGPGSAYSAWAAYNLITNTPTPAGDNGIELSEPVRQALMQTFGRYLPDLASSSFTGVATDPVFSSGGQQMIGVGHDSLGTFLKQIVVVPKDYAIIHAMAGVAIGNSVGLTAQGNRPGVAYQAFGSLYSLISTEQSNLNIYNADQQDIRNQELNAMISIAQTGFGMVPGGKVLTKAQELASLTSPLIPQFSTDNGANAVADADTRQGMEELMVEIPLIRGLVKTGALTLPPGSFDANGNPTPALGDWLSAEGYNVKVGDQTLAQWMGEVQQAMGVSHLAFGSKN